MTRDQLARYRIRLRLGDTFTGEDVERLLDWLDDLEQLYAQREAFLSCLIEESRSPVSALSRGGNA